MELICIFAVFNKASGIYGLLALLTGAPISPWQMSMYLYSIGAAAIFAYSLRHIKQGPASAFEILIFSWFYVLDTVINLAYTALFATSWFLVVSQQPSGAAARVMNDTAGFTSPTHTVSSVIFHATQAADGTPITEVHGTPADHVPVLSESVLHPEQLPSVITLGLILLIKVYFILIVMSYARNIVVRASSSSLPPYDGYKQRFFRWMTKGSYWSMQDDNLRLSKTRSSQRDETSGRR